jgi:hypothetical protein
VSCQEIFASPPYVLVCECQRSMAGYGRDAPHLNELGVVDSKVSGNALDGGDREESGGGKECGVHGSSV